MNEKGNFYALAALKDKRASLASDILQCEQRLRHLREALVHVDATLHLLDPSLEPDRIPNKRPTRRIKLFRQGELGRLIIDTLRQGHGDGMTTTEIVDAILHAGGHGAGARTAVGGRVRGNLAYLLSREKVEKMLEDGPVRWRLV